MPFWADHALFLVLALVFPLRTALHGYRRLMHAEAVDLPRVRLSLYRQAMAIQWALTAAVLLVWELRSRDWGVLGLVPRATPAALVLAALAVAAVVVVVVQRRRTLASRQAMEHVRHQLRHVERMLPHGPIELRRFFALAATAGICEELLYRGYLLWYLERWIGWVPAIAVAAVIFGFGHLYQGRRGILTTALVGIVFCAIYLVSGSLYLGMLLHALADAHSGHLGYVAFRREAEAAAQEVEAGAGPPA